MQNYIAGVDLGGTNIRIALAQREAPEHLLVHVNRETPVQRGPAGFLEVVDEGLMACCETLQISRDAIQGVGCTIPGITDAAAGKAILVTNLPGWDNYLIKDKLEQVLQMPAAVDNDVNAAALGEYWYGQGRGTHSIVMM